MLLPANEIYFASFRNNSITPGITVQFFFLIEEDLPGNG